jgi:hypothetical protein
MPIPGVLPIRAYNPLPLAANWCAASARLASTPGPRRRTTPAFAAAAPVRLFPFVAFVRLRPGTIVTKGNNRRVWVWVWLGVRCGGGVDATEWGRARRRAAGAPRPHRRLR